jgi:hypothetical protein
MAKAVLSCRKRFSVLLDRRFIGGEQNEGGTADGAVSSCLTTRLDDHSPRKLYASLSGSMSQMATRKRKQSDFRVSFKRHPSVWITLVRTCLRSRFLHSAKLGEMLSSNLALIRTFEIDQASVLLAERSDCKKRSGVGKSISFVGGSSGLFLRRGHPAGAGVV